MFRSARFPIGPEVGGGPWTRSPQPRGDLIACLSAAAIFTLIAPGRVESTSATATLVAAGGDHSCAVTRTGGVLCWGANNYGQLGDGTTLERTTPVNVIGLGTGVSSLAIGMRHTCALTNTGGVKCWGANWYGHLGDGTTTNRLTPVNPPGLASGVSAISASLDHIPHTCALTSAGAVQCWGSNTHGQLGDGTSVGRNTPTDVTGLASDVSAVAAGGSHTCVVTGTGGVKCWGWNAWGQVGNGTWTDQLTPVDVTGLDSGVTAIAAGLAHTCALTVAGGVKCWGVNIYRALGDGTMENRNTPVDVTGLTSKVKAIAAGGYFTCVVTEAGGVKCWGMNLNGQLGDGSLTSGVAAVSAGPQNTCALTSAGTVKCWGGNLGSAPVDVPLTTSYTRFLAEGATSDLFDTQLALLNPGPQDVTAKVTFLRSGHTAPLITQVPVPTRRRVTVNPKSIPGLDIAEFSTSIQSDEPLVIDRTMSWSCTEAYGAHAETAVANPSLTWYLAEGATHSGFNLFYLLQNPNTVAATVRVRYLRPSGAPLEKMYTLTPYSRTNIWVNREEFDGVGLALASTEVSAVFEVSNGQPIIVERAMYLDVPGQPFGAGHESAGITAPALDWFLAEGATGDFFDLFVLIANPESEDARIEATYLLPDGTTLVRPYTVPANTRFNIWVDLEDARLADTAVSTTIRSTNGVPVIVERAMWWPGPTAATWEEAHNSAGATATGTRWALAAGEVDASRGMETYVLIANTSAFPATVKVTVLFEDGTSADQTYANLPARSRFNVPVGAFFRQAAGKRFGALVESLGTTPAQIVVERAMYWDALEQKWAAGTNALATKLQ